MPLGPLGVPHLGVATVLAEQVTVIALLDYLAGLQHDDGVGDDDGGQPMGDDQYVAFCGAGPLPLTGVLWHLRTGDRVTLLEIDDGIADLARRVIDRLTRLGIVAPRAIEVEVGDVATLTPVGGPSREARRQAAHHYGLDPATGGR